MNLIFLTIITTLFAGPLVAQDQSTDNPLLWSVSRVSQEVKQRTTPPNPFEQEIQGAWAMVRRICVSDLSETALANPTQVYDVNLYYQTYTFSGSQYTIDLNEFRNGFRCIRQVNGSFGLWPFSTSTTDAVLAISLDSRYRLYCDPNYKGPWITMTHQFKWSNFDHSKFILSTVSGDIRPGLCPDDNDFLVTEWEKYVKLPLTE